MSEIVRSSSTGAHECKVLPAQTVAWTQFTDTQVIESKTQGRVISQHKRPARRIKARRVCMPIHPEFQICKIHLQALSGIEEFGSRDTS